MKEPDKNVLVERYMEDPVYKLSIIGMLLLSPEGKILSANPVALTLFNENQLIGKHFEQLFYTDPPFDLKTLLISVYTGEMEDQPHIVELGFSEESSFWANVLFSTIEENNNKAILCQVQNISELKKANERSDYHNHLLNELINSIPDNIFVKDTDSRFLLGNLSVAKNMGVSSQQELLGKTDFDFYPKKLAFKYRKDEMDIIRSGKPKLEIIEQLIDKDHNIHWYATSKTPLYNNNGEIIGIMGIGREITRLIKEQKALKKAKQVAEKANQLKTAFLANLSHEVRTPLNGILGFSQFLKGACSNDPKLEKYTDYIIHNGNRLLHLITDIIDISKIDSGQLSIKKKQFNINDTIRQLQESTRTALVAENKDKITFNLEVMDITNPVVLFTDDQRLKQILHILLSNAVKFTERGVISLGYASEDNYFRFFVKDTGIGIEKKDQKHIFDRFRQADFSLARQYEGVGLGLSIAKELVKLLHGEIRLESVPNQGSEFSVVFPLKEILANS